MVKRRRPSEPLLNVFTFRIIGRDGKPKKRKVRHTSQTHLIASNDIIVDMIIGQWDCWPSGAVARWSQLLCL